MSDLTAPGAVKRIRERDRLGICAGAEGMYLTYPERAGYRLPDDGDGDGENRNGLAVAPTVNEMPLVRRGRIDAADGSRTRSVPDVGVPFAGVAVVATGHPSNDVDDDDARGVVMLAKTGESKRAELAKSELDGSALGRSLGVRAVGPAVVRPRREVLYDVNVGVEPATGPTDKEKHASLLDQYGLDTLPESAYRDIEQLD